MWWAPVLGSPREKCVLVERENVEVVEDVVSISEVMVLVHAVVVVEEQGVGVQRDFTSGHVPCRSQV